MSAKSDAAQALCIPVLDELSFFQFMILTGEVNRVCSSKDSVAEDLESDGLVDLESLSFNQHLVWNEIVLYASILLRNVKVIFRPEASTEYNNDTAYRIISYLAEDARRASQSYLQVSCWYTGKLPDVCGSCFRSYGLTEQGRYRLFCGDCRGSDSRMAFDRLTSLHRLCPIGYINESVLSQLIYKYYSDNGDSTWQIIKTIPTL